MNHLARLGISLLVVFLIAIVGANRLHGQAQSFNASLSGIVTDNTQATVPGATVTLTNPSKGFSRTFTTTGDGRYVFSLVPPGDYVLKAEKDGFAPYTQTGLALTIGQAAAQNVTLQVASAQQAVTVSSAAPLVNTTNANVGSDVSGRQIVELPLNKRMIVDLVFLDSSVNNSTQLQSGGAPTQALTDQNSTFFNFGGGRMGTTAYMLDGHWAVAGDWGGLIFQPSVDEVQELKIQTHAFTAQYGWSMGNVVHMVTKSGTDSVHGSAFEFLRNDAMDANNFFANRTGTPKDNFRRNQFGFTVGGPVVIPKLYNGRNKTFFFGAFEGQRLSTPQTLIATVPTDDMKTGNFSALLGDVVGTDALGRSVRIGQVYDPFSTRKVTAGQLDPVSGLVAAQTGYVRDPFSGNVIPSSRFDSVAKNLVKYWPTPTNLDTSSNFIKGGTVPLSVDQFTVRVDHNISENTRLFGRYSQKRVNLGLTDYYFGKDNPGGPQSYGPNPRLDGGLNATHTFSPTLVMSVNVGWNRWTEGFRPQGYGFKPSNVGLPSFLDARPNFPNIAIDGVYGLGAGYYSKTPRENRTVGLDVTKIAGRHTLNIGSVFIGSLVYEQFIDPIYANFDRGMTSGPDPNAGDPSSGYGFASFLLGTGSNGNYPIQADTALIKKYAGWYFQDDWKITRKLTLNLGFRYDFQTAPTERFDRFTRFMDRGANPLSQEVGFTVPGYISYVGGGKSRSKYDAEFTNFQPRVGFAYEVANKLVMRAGFGLFNTPAVEMSGYQGMTLYGFTQTTPWVATVDGITPKNLLSNPFPDGLLEPVGKAEGDLTQVGQDINWFDNKRRTPYVEEWSFGFQFAPTPNDNIDATYVGNHGVGLLFRNNPANQLSPPNQALGDALLDQVANPYYGHITSSACGLDQPMVTRAQLLRPFPEYCGVAHRQSPSSFSSYNAVSINYTHRWSQGLHLLASFTVSKYLDNSSGPEGWASTGQAGIKNIYDLSGEKSLSLNDIPKSLVINYIYELPVGRGRKFGSNMSKVADAVVGGWQVAGVTTFKDGYPLAIGAVTNNSGTGGGSQRPNIVGDPHVSNPTIDRWFNTDAFAQPAPYTWGNGPRTMPNLRAPGLNNFDLTAEKTWTWRERLHTQFRVEAYNAFNHPYFYAPDQFYGSSTFGKITVAGFARSVQLGLKIYW